MCLALVVGNQLADDEVERGGPEDWAAPGAVPRPLVDVNLQRRRRRLSPLDYDDYVDDVNKRYMRFGRRDDNAAATADKRYMRFGRAGTHFHPLMAFAKRYMRFGRR